MGDTCGVWTDYPSGAPEFTTGLSRIRVAWSLLFCVAFCMSFFVLFRFGHCVVCPSIGGFWLPLWYLQTFHCTRNGVCLWKLTDSIVFVNKAVSTCYCFTNIYYLHNTLDNICIICYFKYNFNLNVNRILYITYTIVSHLCSKSWKWNNNIQQDESVVIVIVWQYFSYIVVVSFICDGNGENHRPVGSHWQTGHERHSNSQL
jgi:hypothetical protein